MSNTKGKIKKRNILIFGWGINDSDYVTQINETVNGKQVCIWVCPYYKKWVDMIRRVTKSTRHKNNSYSDVIIWDGWKSFMKFREWMITSNWEEGLVLDKDLLITGNRCYHPETCCFISPEVNSFITRGNGLSGNTYIGYHFRKRNKSKPYQAEIGNPFTGKSEFLGDHFTELEAHLAWKKRKHELACMLADLQSDPRVAQALRTRYADLTTPYIP